MFRPVASLCANTSVVLLRDQELAKQSLAQLKGGSWVEHAYIYIYMCVCVCVSIYITHTCKYNIHIFIYICSIYKPLSNNKPFDLLDISQSIYHRAV